MACLRLVMVLAVLPLGLLAAQADTSAWRALLQPGMRLRVTLAPPNRVPLVGTLKSVAGDELLLETGDTAQGMEQHAIPFPMIVRLERPVGRERRVWRGMGRGALIGGAAVGAVGFVTYAPCEGFCFMAPASRAQSFGVGALAGIVVGGIIGAIVPPRTDRWADVGRVVPR